MAGADTPNQTLGLLLWNAVKSYEEGDGDE
jgi:hypothetical protein